MTTHEMNEQEVLKAELDVLRVRHRRLDEKIHALVEDGAGTAFEVRRLKKQKLVLKDQIAQIEDRLFPDIIA
ncbi:YdcH family protein [Paracoccaceae bacterium GXU_MW_L88]